MLVLLLLPLPKLSRLLSPVKRPWLNNPPLFFLTTLGMNILILLTIPSTILLQVLAIFLMLFCLLR